MRQSTKRHEDSKASLAYKQWSQKYWTEGYSPNCVVVPLLSGPGSSPGIRHTKFITGRQYSSGVDNSVDISGTSRLGGTSLMDGTSSISSSIDNKWGGPQKTWPEVTRKGSVDELSRYILDNDKNCFWVIGSEGIGKRSTIRQALKVAKQNSRRDFQIRELWIDFAEFGNGNYAVVCRRFEKAVSEALAEAFAAHPISLPYDILRARVPDYDSQVKSFLQSETEGGALFEGYVQAIDKKQFDGPKMKQLLQQLEQDRILNPKITGSRSLGGEVVGGETSRGGRVCQALELSRMVAYNTEAKLRAAKATVAGGDPADPVDHLYGDGICNLLHSLVLLEYANRIARIPLIIDNIHVLNKSPNLKPHGHMWLRSLCNILQIVKTPVIAVTHDSLTAVDCIYNHCIGRSNRAAPLGALLPWLDSILASVSPSSMATPDQPIQTDHCSNTSGSPGSNPAGHEPHLSNGTDSRQPSLAIDRCSAAEESNSVPETVGVVDLSEWPQQITRSIMAKRVDGNDEIMDGILTCVGGHPAMLKKLAATFADTDEAYKTSKKKPKENEDLIEDPEFRKTKSSADEDEVDASRLLDRYKDVLRAIPKLVLAQEVAAFQYQVTEFMNNPLIVELRRVYAEAPLHFLVTVLETIRMVIERPYVSISDFNRISHTVVIGLLDANILVCRLTPSRRVQVATTFHKHLLSAYIQHKLGELTLAERVEYNLNFLKNRRALKYNLDRLIDGVGNNVDSPKSTQD